MYICLLTRDYKCRVLVENHLLVSTYESKISKILNFVVKLVQVVYFIVICSWIQAFGEAGMQCLLKHLRDSCEKTGNLEKRIQHECVRCLKAFMNNKVLF